MKKKKEIKIKKNAKYLIILALFLISITGVYTLARYAQKLNAGTTGIYAKTIVLSSDVLKEEPTNKNIYEKNIKFSISNYNDNKITYNDLKYKIVVKDEDENICESCTIKINDSNKSTNTLKSLHSTQKSTDNIEIIFPSLGTYTIEAKTVDTTVVQLSLIVTVSSSEDYSYYLVKDKESYVEVIIKTSKKVTNSTSFTINTPGLVPDNYNTLMENWTTKEKQTLTGLNPNSVYSLIFFKTNVSNNYEKQEEQMSDNVINISVN